MATATFPAGAPVSIPSSGPEALRLEPPGDVLYEVVNGRIVEPPPMGAYPCTGYSRTSRTLHEIVPVARLAICSAQALSSGWSESSSGRA